MKYLFGIACLCLVVGIVLLCNKPKPTQQSTTKSEVTDLESLLKTISRA